MPKLTFVIVIALAAVLSLPALAQTPPPVPAPGAAPGATHDATYGRVKELAAGQKIVIDVDNAPDKNYDLKDKDTTFKLAKGLKVGDPVKITEHDMAGQKKTIEIAKDTRTDVKHGDSDRKQEK